jgi:RND family efflux transporter MFP subunit
MPESRNFSLRTAAIAAVAIAVLVVAIGIFTRVRAERQLTTWTSAQSTPIVSVITPKATGTSDALTLPGNVQALNSAAIFARTTGYVRQWYVDIGDNVHTGQTLAILDAPDLDQQVAAGRADLRTAQANQNLAQTTATRWTALLAKDAVSKQVTDQTIGDLAAKTAITNAAEANVRRLDALKSFTRLTAPFDGVVTSRSTQIGALVPVGTPASVPLFTVSDVSRMRIYVQVPQAYSGAIHTGLHASLTLPEYPGRTFDVVLTRSASAVDPLSGTMLVELQADNKDRALKPGAYAKVTFPPNSASGAVTVPASALMFGPKGNQVATLGADGRAVLKPITVGEDDGDTLKISAGLAATDRVIDNPPDALRTGDLVRIAPSGNVHAHG